MCLSCPDLEWLGKSLLGKKLRVAVELHDAEMMESTGFCGCSTATIVVPPVATKNLSVPLLSPIPVMV